LEGEFRISSRVLSLSVLLSSRAVILKSFSADAASKYRRLAVRQLDHVRVRNPVRRRHHHFVAAVQQHGHQVEQALLGAVRDDDLLCRELQSVVLPELAQDRRLEFRRAVDLRVAGLPVVDGLDGGFADVGRCVEIGLAGAQRDDVAALGTQLHPPHAHLDGCGRPDLVDFL
jgi:hypothetical protein